MNKSPVLALFLALFPGFGHIYLGYKIRGGLYPLFFLGGIGLAFAAGIITGDSFIALALLACAGAVWLVNMMDIIITMISIKSISQPRILNENDTSEPNMIQNERFITILLSFMPGVGHFYLGLTHRGLTLLAAFIGIITMVLFISFLTSGVFLIFLLALPIIWIYGLFDVIQLLNKKQAGEMLSDRTIMDDFDKLREENKKSKMLATALSIFPGAGHMYLGLQKRGLQLMAAFLLSIYILDVLHLTFFLFIIPIIWFFSFFDALQSANKFEEGPVEDIPIFKQLAIHQNWLGLGLILLGCFYLFDSILIPVIAEQIREIYDISIWHFYHQYFQVTIVCLLLIGIGIKLILGPGKRKQVDTK
ncbi:hypothetical protein SAMN04487944_101561 [Gracilibacillus ureilyticus]|uniref:TM2 domain-containing protein n=1 Tax=Gracilibacillus ureilyticus TaxID=531814 RepID=A0A1H9M6Q5_9BACI|nr:hypothetical protein [Gracilibacillus ureilyticus]SER18803.1 hypothetical protein SAMN04487944_101561 [Gracilibacillus ureilyticus]